MNSSLTTPVVDNANMFQDDVLLFEGFNMGNANDGSSTKMETEIQRAPENLVSDCTSLDGGNRDDSTDEGGESDGLILQRPTKPSSTRHFTGTSNDDRNSNKLYVHDKESSTFPSTHDGVHGGNFNVNDVNNGSNNNDNNS